MEKKLRLNYQESIMNVKKKVPLTKYFDLLHLEIFRSVTFDSNTLTNHRCNLYERLKFQKFS